MHTVELENLIPTGNGASSSSGLANIHDVLHEGLASSTARTPLHRIPSFASDPSASAVDHFDHRESVSETMRLAEPSFTVPHYYVKTDVPALGLGWTPTGIQSISDPSSIDFLNFNFEISPSKSEIYFLPTPQQWVRVSWGRL